MGFTTLMGDSQEVANPSTHLSAQHDANNIDIRQGMVVIKVVIQNL